MLSWNELTTYDSWSCGLWQKELSLQTWTLQVMFPKWGCCPNPAVIRLLRSKRLTSAVTQHAASSGPVGGSTAPYLVNTLGVLQPGEVHLLHVVGARPIQERLRSHRCCVAPDWLKRPCAARGGSCDWPLLADSLSRLRGGERTQSRRTSP